MSSPESVALPLKIFMDHGSFFLSWVKMQFVPNFIIRNCKCGMDSRCPPFFPIESQESSKTWPVIGCKRVEVTMLTVTFFFILHSDINCVTFDLKENNNLFLHSISKLHRIENC